MEKQGGMKEIRLDIKSDLVMNIMNFLMAEEGYIFVGNEKEIWLENLSHPTVQLVYINQKQIYNEMQSQLLFKQIQRVRSRVRQRYLLLRLNVLVIDTDYLKSTNLDTDLTYVKVIHASTGNELKNNEDLNKFFPKLEHVSLSSSMAELILQMQNVSREKALSIRKMIDADKRSYVVTGYLLLLVVLFVFIQLQPIKNGATMIEFGAKYNPLILSGDYWRLITPAFLHLDLMHLLLNGVFIYQIGKMVEKMFGWWRTVIILFASAFVGNLFSFAFIENISFGASTVAFGLIGAILFMGLENRKMYIHLVKGFIFPILAFSLVWGLIDPSIDLLGHIGGFLGGFLISSIIGTPTSKFYISRTCLAIATLFFLILGSSTRGSQLTNQIDYDQTNIALVRYYLEKGNGDEAMNVINKLQIDLTPYLKDQD
ncbi:MAG: rhomboid family protein [Turicibacter sp.]